MCALGLAYAAKFVWDARMATIGVYGVAPQDVRYVYGPPQSVEDGGRLYRYDDSRRVALARFGEDGLLRSFSCSAKAGHAGECDEVLYVGIGDSEEQVMLQLGAPSRSSYVGDDRHSALRRARPVSPHAPAQGPCHRGPQGRELQRLLPPGTLADDPVASVTGARQKAIRLRYRSKASQSSCAMM
jgi:hypothetical protein